MFWYIILNCFNSFFIFLDLLTFFLFVSLFCILFVSFISFSCAVTFCLLVIFSRVLVLCNSFCVLFPSFLLSPSIYGLSSHCCLPVIDLRAFCISVNCSFTLLIFFSFFFSFIVIWGLFLISVSLWILYLSVCILYSSALHPVYLFISLIAISASSFSE